MSSHLLNVGGGILLVDGLGRDGAPPADRLDDVGGERGLHVLLVLGGQQGGLGLLHCFLGHGSFRL